MIEAKKNGDIVADASDLGWAPGTWPLYVTIEDIRWERKFEMTRGTSGDCTGWLYYNNAKNIVMKVYND